MSNYSIDQQGEYMFSYYEDDGDDYETDMAKMAADPLTQYWWSLVIPLMQPMEDHEGDSVWSEMLEVYHLE